MNPKYEDNFEERLKKISSEYHENINVMEIVKFLDIDRYSFFASIHNIMQTNKIIPEKLTLKDIA